MWKIVSIRRNYYTTEQTLVWFKHYNGDAACKFMEMMGVDAACFHDYNPDDADN